MPPVFKALATIIVWVLFISGLLMALSSLVIGTVGGVLWRPEIPLLYPIVWAVSGMFGILSVVCMKLRQMLE